VGHYRYALGCLYFFVRTWRSGRLVRRNYKGKQKQWGSKQVDQWLRWVIQHRSRSCLEAWTILWAKRSIHGPVKWGWDYRNYDSAARKS
jgi:hypothetical protein